MQTCCLLWEPRFKTGSRHTWIRNIAFFICQNPYDTIYTLHNNTRVLGLRVVFSFGEKVLTLDNHHALPTKRIEPILHQFYNWVYLATSGFFFKCIELSRKPDQLWRKYSKVLFRNSPKNTKYLYLFQIVLNIFYNCIICFIAHTFKIF